MKTFTEASLQINGDGVDPEICSRLLGVLPDIKWKKGDVIRVDTDGTIRTRPSGLWGYDAEKHVQHSDPYDPLLLVNHIIQVFSGKRAQFDQIHKSMGDGEKPDIELDWFETNKYITVTLSITWGVPHGSYILEKRLLETILNMGVDAVRCFFVSVDYPQEDEEKMDD